MESLHHSSGAMATDRHKHWASQSKFCSDVISSSCLLGPVAAAPQTVSAAQAGVLSSFSVPKPPLKWGRLWTQGLRQGHLGQDPHKPSSLSAA